MNRSCFGESFGVMPYTIERVERRGNATGSGGVGFSRRTSSVEKRRPHSLQRRRRLTFW